MAKKTKSKKKAAKGTSSKRQPFSIPWRPLIIVIFTFIVFSPSLDNEFVNWDDDKNLYENQEVLNLNAKNVKKLFTSDVIGNYNPLSNLLLGIQHKIFQGRDNYYAGFHFTNILLHLVCVFLVFLTCRQLGANDLTSTLITLLFAIHPLRVESVAWITEIKDVLFGSFYFASILAYLHFLKRKKRSLYLLTFILFFIGLFAKIQMVVLPLSLVLIDYWKNNDKLIRSAIQKWPFFLMSLIFGVLGIFVLKGQGSLDAETTFSGIERLFIGSYSLVVYLIKSIVPYRLSPLYPYPPILTLWHYLSMIPFLLYVFGLYYSWKKDHKLLFFGGAFFLINIFFLLQFLGAGQGYLADRFTYVAYFGLFFIYGHLITSLISNPKYSKAILALFVIIIVGYSYLTYQQTKVWKNGGTLWTHVLKYYQSSTLPYGNRGNFYRDRGENKKALEDYSATIRLKPKNAKPYNSRAKLYFSMNQDQKALADYNMAVAFEPNNAEYLINRGAAFAKLGRYDDALTDLNKGLSLNANSANGYLNRSLVYQQRGQLDLTLQDLNAYLRLNPNHADIWYEKGRVLNIQGSLDDALKSYSQAIALNGNNGIYFLERSKVYFKLRRFSECRMDVQKAKQLGSPLGASYSASLKSNNVL
jgi:tetratricopeptide (TPR) repeat protein